MTSRLKIDVLASGRLVAAGVQDVTARRHAHQLFPNLSAAGLAALQRAHLLPPAALTPLDMANARALLAVGDWNGANTALSPRPLVAGKFEYLKSRQGVVTSGGNGCLTFSPLGPGRPLQIWLRIPAGATSASVLVETPPAPPGTTNYLAAVLVPRRGPSSSVPVELVVPHSGSGYLSDNAARATLVIAWAPRDHAETLRDLRWRVRSTSLLSPPARRPFTQRVSPVASLFPVAGRSDWPAWSVAVAYVIGLATTSAAALLRQPGVPATKTIWAEDGRIFYAQATTLSFWRTLTTLHNGYMQLFPRLAVQLVHFVPVADVSTLFALVGAVSLGAICCLVFHMARGHIAAPGLRALLAAGMVLLPVANVELLDNLVNVPWWLFFAAFWPCSGGRSHGPAGRAPPSCALWPPGRRLWSAFSCRWPWRGPYRFGRQGSKRPLEGSYSASSIRRW